ncbi:MAG: family 78 glycoside hydrolase catalytic domain [Clostridia bacterium]|nr:family 78 glycoside hydrolase catalytic domain [Clostridia bacterium]
MSMRLSSVRFNGMWGSVGTGCDIRIHWNYHGISRRNEYQSTFQVKIVAGDSIVFDSGKIESRDMTFTVSASDGIRPGTVYTCTLTVWTDTGEKDCRILSFETAIDDLEKSPWIGCGVTEEPSAPVFCKRFTPSGEIARARVYVTGLGLIHCKCNDHAVNSGMLLPPNTVYDKKVYFETLDITSLLQNGENTFTVQLGGGYNADYSQWGYRYFTPKGFRAAIVLTYTDGSTERIDTDETWLWQDSPITANGLYLGEEYDARRTFTEWTPAVLDPENAPAGKLLPDEMPPLKSSTCIPVTQWETEEGTIYDFGKNIQGVCWMRLKAPAGCVIQLHHFEMIHPDGTPDKFTNRAARAIDIYTCAGRKSEVYQPRFTYHGFRYVLVKHSMPLEQFAIHAMHISAAPPESIEMYYYDAEENTRFRCSEPILNKLHTLCTNSIRSNLVSIPTDCPVRDERTPCLMDSQMYEPAAMYNFDMYAYYKKWLGDIAAEPESICSGNMDWSGDGLMLTYRIYKFYGDKTPAEKLYPHLKKAMENWMEKSEDGVWPWGFGDWCLPNDNTWEGFGGCKAATNTSLLHAYTGIMAEFADLFGKPEDKEQFLAMGETVRNGFIGRYWHEDGTVGEGRQPEMFLPLYYGILTGEKAKKTQAALLEKVRREGHFDTGGFSTRTVLPVLADADALDLFLDTIRKNHYPGFGYWNALGATSLWEQWASKGNMHSHSHAMHSGIEAALFQTLCGIVPTTPGFRKFTIAPRLPKDMRFVECRLFTYAGDIHLSVEKFTDCLTLSCTIPPNTEADLTFPDMDSFGNCILFDGERQIDKSRELHLGSGNYTFRLVPETYLAFEPYKK